MKYILVTGGVISGIGKGVIASSIGTMLKACGHKVTAIKIDPFLNIDVGSLSPDECGEIYVLDDGGEVNLGLGNYECFLDIKLHDNHITLGKIYASMMSKERKWDFLREEVHIPRITDEIQNCVESVSLIPVEKDRVTIPEVCIIELGGIIGDMECKPFVEAFYEFQWKVKENFCSLHVSLVPQIICRSEKPMNNEIKIRVSKLCRIPPDQAVS